MSKDELLKLRTEALENLLGYFGTPAARHVMGSRWTSDHDFIIRFAKEAIATTEEPALERFLRSDKAPVAPDDEPSVIGPAHLLRSLKKAGLTKDSHSLDPVSWNLATENAAALAETLQEEDFVDRTSASTIRAAKSALAAIARMIRLEKMDLFQQKKSAKKVKK